MTDRIWTEVDAYFEAGLRDGDPAPLTAGDKGYDGFLMARILT